MTKKRYDDHSTEFGLWLRNQKELDSKLGFIVTNLDYIYRNYKTGHFMLIEEKRYGKEPLLYQKQTFEIIHKLCQNHPKYRGFHLIVFENTSPEDGKIYLDNKEISKQELIDFLSFKDINIRR